MPDGWAWCRLGNIGSWGAGATPSRNNKEYYQNGAIPWLKTGDLNDGDIYSVPEYITEKALRETSVQLNPVGSILIAMYGATIGKVGVLQIPATTNQACCACSVFNGIDNRYLFFFLLSQKENFKILGGGGAQPNISKDKIINYLFPLPPLAEQKRIVSQIETLLGYVDIIDTDAETLDKSITLTKQKILDLAIRGKLVPQDPADEPASELLKKIKAEKDTLVKAGKLKKDKHESFIFKSDDNCYHENIDGKSSDITDEIPFDLPESWCWCRLKHVFSVVSARRVHKADWKSSGIPFYRAREIAKLSETGSINNDLFISEEQYNAFKQSSGVPSKGDLMVTAVGTIGKVYVVREHDVFYYKDASVVCFENNHSLNPYFYKNIFSAPFVVTQIYANSTGSTVDTITIEKAEQYLIPLPPLAEQKRIVSQVEKFFSVLETMRG